MFLCVRSQIVSLHKCNNTEWSEQTRKIFFHRGLLGCGTVWTCGYQHFNETCCPHLQPSRSRQYISPKHWCPLASPLGIETQKKTTIGIITAVWTLDLIYRNVLIVKAFSSLYFAPLWRKMLSELCRLSYLVTSSLSSSLNAEHQIYLTLFYIVILIFSFGKVTRR